MDKIRWGILGTANIARAELAPAIMRASNAEVGAIASRSSKVFEVANELSIESAYESYDELLEDDEIDAVYIPLPNHLHKEWVIKAARKGKHVLCEKPASLTTEEAREMVQVCKDSNVKFMEAFMYQFHPQHHRVRSIIASGEIGEVMLFKSSHSFYFAERANDIRMMKEGGGSIYDVGCYSIHAMRSILRTEPVEVQAYAELDPDAQVDVSAYSFLKLENGAKAVLDCSFDMVDRNEYEIVGTKGSIKVPFAFRPDHNGGLGHVIVQTGTFKREEKIYGDIYRMEVEHFSRAVLEDLEPAYSGASTIQNMRVIDACYESIRTGERVKIKR
ncbi:Gfo/Idh/MocA family protein [Planomicrobium sp. CPCC 101110]|uniref:Gfo/Idh/MocA family protein n=1 Tax=Planomicrobium sp. CPCC 101110 TaxID=2599619 RepID=UPI0011B588C3|nr:Gfo/Idh/MocA family oxidoreductase [Planomicrobium sp. CPCC 101110]TWT27132.1 Gfo/Idh/MocA family oxidoreductase [Planomicrobium sp. CPCC 101110]